MSLNLEEKEKEILELNKKIISLEKFIAINLCFETFDEMQTLLINIQLNAMKSYSQALNASILFIHYKKINQ